MSLYSRSSFQVFGPRPSGGSNGGGSGTSIGQSILNNTVTAYTKPPNITYINNTTVNHSLNIADESKSIYIVNVDLLRDDRNFTITFDKNRVRTGASFDIFFKINVDWKYHPDMSKCFNIIFNGSVDSMFNDSYININDSIVYVNETNTDLALANDENNVNKIQLEFSDFYGLDMEDATIPPEKFVVKNLIFLKIIVSKTNKDIVILKS
jgi:hypothetical protein